MNVTFLPASIAGPPDWDIVSTNVSTGQNVLIFYDPNSFNASASHPSSDWWRERVQVPPDWSELWAGLRWTWQLHVYCMACLFLLLSFSTFFAILGLRAQVSAKPHLSSLNMFLFILSSSRCVSLFLDPYGSKKFLPQIMLAILWDLAFPCLVSSFSLLQLAILHDTGGVVLNFGSQMLRSEMGMTLVITSHFCLIIASDILWSMQNTMKMVWLFTQIAFSFWGIFLSIIVLVRSISTLKRSSSSYNTCPVMSLTKTRSTFSCDRNGMISSLGIRHPSLVTGRGVVVKSASSGDQCNCGKVPASSSAHLGRRNSSYYAPKIRITDENDQSFCVEKESRQICSNSPLIAKPNAIEVSIDSSDPQPSHPYRPNQKKAHKSLYDGTSKDEDAIQLNPLIVPPCSHCHCVESHLGIVSDVEPISSIQSELMSYEDFSRDQKMKKTRKVDSGTFEEVDFKLRADGSIQEVRMRRLVKKVLLCSTLGLICCLLQMYGVLGPHGLSVGQKKPAVMPWFCYQSIYRLVEFAMGCSIARITCHSIHTHCYFAPHNSGSKYRNALFP